MNNPTCPLCPPDDPRPAALIIGTRRKGRGWQAYSGYVCEEHDQEYREMMRTTFETCPYCLGQMRLTGEYFTANGRGGQWLKCENGHYKVSWQAETQVKVIARATNEAIGIYRY